jgi:hypothetical protein
MSTTTKNTPKFSPDIERHRMIPVPDAAAFKALSVDSFERHYGHLIRKVSPGRRGVKLGDLMDEAKTTT